VEIIAHSFVTKDFINFGIPYSRALHLCNTDTNSPLVSLKPLHGSQGLNGLGETKQALGSQI